MTVSVVARVLYLLLKSRNATYRSIEKRMASKKTPNAMIIMGSLSGG